MTPSQPLDLQPLANLTAGPVLAYLVESGAPVALVGGCVRDLFLGRPTHDLDLTVERGGLELARRLAARFGGAYYAMDEARDTGRAILPGDEPLVVDVAAWRGDTLEADLRLRDFTVNAMAAPLGPTGATLFDPLDGALDLQSRLLRAASDRAMADDPVRVLRAIRLQAELAPWGFRLDGDAARQVQESAPLLAQCSSERVRDELVRVLSAPRPGDWLRKLNSLAVLDVVLPETAGLRGVPQSPPHVWDVFSHTAAVLNHAQALAAWICGDEAALAFTAAPWVAESLAATLEPLRSGLAQHLAKGEGAGRQRSQMLAWAALCHDWGKPATARLDPETTQWRFLGHPEAGATLTYEALRRLRFNDAEARRVALVVRHHMRPLLLAVEGPPSRRAAYRYFRDLGDAGIDTALLSLADMQGVYGPTLTPDAWQPVLETAVSLLTTGLDAGSAVVSPPALVDGRDLMTILNLPSGRQIGHLLDAIAEAQAGGDVHTREQALRLARQLSARPVQPTL